MQRSGITVCHIVAARAAAALRDVVRNVPGTPEHCRAAGNAEPLRVGPGLGSGFLDPPN